MITIDQLLAALGRERRSAPELARMLGVSHQTVGRLLRSAGDRVVHLGAARATRHVARRSLFGAGVTLPLFEVDAEGGVSRLGMLEGLADGCIRVAGASLPRWVRGNDDDGVYPGLPWFLDDLHPSGFLGRMFARDLAATWHCPDDVRVWDEELIGRVLLDFGEMLPGNLLVGTAAAGRAHVWTAERVYDPAAEYPALAREVVAGCIPSSASGGEQPKFTAWRDGLGHVIVKFSPTGTSDVACRWRDLLRAEYHAMSALAAHGIAAAETHVHQSGDRVFLESVRFDRRGAFGRLPIFSIGAVDAEFAGIGRDWTRIADALHARGLVDERTRAGIGWLQRFGTAIENSDMHVGNLSLAPSGDGFGLSPVYDMLPMAHAPRHGELPRPLPRMREDAGASSFARGEAKLPAVGEVVRDFLARVRHDRSISEGFRGLMARGVQ